MNVSSRPSTVHARITRRVGTDRVPDDDRSRGTSQEPGRCPGAFSPTHPQKLHTQEFGRKLICEILMPLCFQDVIGQILCSEISTVPCPVRTRVPEIHSGAGSHKAVNRERVR